MMLWIVSNILFDVSWIKKGFFKEKTNIFNFFSSFKMLGREAWHQTGKLWFKVLSEVELH